MVRTQIYLEPAQDKALKEQAKALGLSKAELIRRKIAQPIPGSVSYPTNPEAWDEVLRLMEERAKLPDLKQERAWSREDAYEERLGRFSR